MLGVTRVTRPLPESCKPESRRQTAVLRGMRLRRIDSPPSSPDSPAASGERAGVRGISREGPNYMDFEFTDEQRLLGDSVDRLLADHYGFAERRGYLAEPEGWSTALWSRYAEQGLLGLPFAEEYGGFGGSAIEIMLVMEAFGRVLALEPYLATVVLGGTALRLAGSAAQKSAIMPSIAEGRMTLAFAHGERQA